ncbi:MAG: hypothetical protein KDB21_12500 [Acidimicrobiales bacterium]|nr:hypothetical protein [Acidimicrobiales bacterium]
MVESNPEVRSTRTRLVSLAYLAVVGFAVSFAVIWFVGALVEAHGPSSTSRGRVLSRDVEEYQARVCRSGSSRFCSYEDRERHTVIGERDDGSTWLVTSEGAYDAVRSGDLVVVSTSTLTDRVVAIENLDDGLERDDWRFVGSEQYFVIIGVSVVVLGGAAATEWARRKGKFSSLGPIARIETLILIPAALGGLALVWYANYAATWGLDVPTAVDEYGSLVAEPFDFTPSGDRVGDAASGGSVTIVGVDQLADAQRQQLSTDGGEGLAVPVVSHVGSGKPVSFWMVDTGADVAPNEYGQIPGRRPVDCPAGLLEYPTQTIDDTEVGFVCFPAGEAGNDLYIVIGNNLLAKWGRVAYEEYFAG